MEQMLQSILMQQKLMEQLVGITTANAAASGKDIPSTSANTDGVMEMLSKCIKEFV